MATADADQQAAAEAAALIGQFMEQKAAEGDDWASAYATFRKVVPADPKTGIHTNDQGWLLYPNGVIVTDSGVLYPTSAHGFDPEEIVGSKAWGEKIQDTWDDEKANEWRAKLWEQGYTGADGLQSEKGGMAYDLINALKAYHANRYGNGGRVLPLAPKGAAGGELKIKDIVDPVALREEVKSWGQVPFEEDLDPDTAEYFANQVLEVARRLMKDKGWTADRAVGTPGTTQSPASGAFLRVQKQYLKDENVEEAMEQLDDDEMDETLRESIVSIAQLGSI